MSQQDSAESRSCLVEVGSVIIGLQGIGCSCGSGCCGCGCGCGSTSHSNKSACFGVGDAATYPLYITAALWMLAVSSGWLHVWLESLCRLWWFVLAGARVSGNAPCAEAPLAKVLDP